jgi:hypothetical protein
VNRHGNKLQDVKPTIQVFLSSSTAIRKDEVILTRHHISRSRLTQGDLPRGELAPLTIPHSLIDCPFYDGMRYHFHIQGSLGDVLRVDNSSVNAVFAYLNKANRPIILADAHEPNTRKKT